MPSSDSANRTRSVGSALRESREARGIPLEEASRVTRIGKNYLTALEEGSFDILPNPAYVKGLDKGPQPAKAPLPPDAPPALPVAAPVLPPRSSAQGHPEATRLAAEKGTVDARTADAESQGAGIVLKLKVNQDCRLNITIDDAISQQYDLKAGDLIEWKGDRVFALDVGNAGGIEAEFNGKQLKPFGEPGKPAHVILKADGASQ